jgi:hypothetical protein
MEAFSLYKFERHFQIAHSTAFRFGAMIALSTEGFVAEKTGEIQHCTESSDRKYRAGEPNKRAAAPSGFEILAFYIDEALSSAWRRTTSTCNHSRTSKGHLGLNMWASIHSRSRKATDLLLNMLFSAQ